MVITAARLQNYRSYSDSSFDFDESVNIIVGPNASGKTNLLDAIFFCSTSKTLVKNKDLLIRAGCDWARIDCITNTNQTRIVKIKETTEFNIDGKIFKRMPESEKVPVVVFEPKHLYFITTSPEMRRSYIDEILAYIDPDFVKVRAQFQKTLKQRNSLLKGDKRHINDQVFAWDIRLCELAGVYVKFRQRLLKRINQDTNTIYTSIAGKKQQLEIVYETKTKITDYADNMLRALQKNIQLDVIRGFTGVGPHRDDIKLMLDGNDIRDRASRGETRTILLTLKIIESNIIEAEKQKKPILLLDDVFGELDGHRRETLTHYIKDNQVFITTTDADIVTHNFTSKTNIIVTG